MSPMLNWVTVRLSPSTSLSLLSTVPDTGVSSVTAIGPSLMATGASLTALTVMVPVAGVPSSRPPLSTEAYWKLVVPFQLALGTKVTVAPLPLAGTLSPMFSTTPLSSKVPLAGRALITK
ncbi:hypothetical protein D3C78_787340 [compost metagenome]